MMGNWVVVFPSLERAERMWSARVFTRRRGRGPVGTKCGGVPPRLSLDNRGCFWAFQLLPVHRSQYPGGCVQFGAVWRAKIGNPIPNSICEASSPPMNSYMLNPPKEQGSCDQERCRTPHSFIHSPKVTLDPGSPDTGESASRLHEPSRIHDSRLAAVESNFIAIELKFD